MAEWDTAYINDLPDSAFACIDPDGEKDEDGRTVPRAKRHYPHHKADGSVDLPHLRNALARVRQDASVSCGEDHLEAHAEAEGVGKSKELPMTTAVKFVKGSELSIEGLGIPYGGPFGGKDLDGEFFTKDTDFCFDWFPERPTIYDHGLDGDMQTTVVGKVTKHEPVDDGIWTRAQLNKNHRYLTAVQELVQQGALSFSSGAMPHLVQKDVKTGEITRWPWIELSLTPTPANPDAVIYAVKTSTALAHLSAFEGGFAPAAESYADHFDRVLEEVKALTGRTEDIASLRAKVGRVLSAANRERLATLRERISETTTQAGAVLKDLDDLLRATDPEAEKRAHALFVAFLANQAAELGVPLKEN